MGKFEPTLDEPVSPQSQEFEKDFKKTMVKTAPELAPKINMDEVNSMLSEVEHSLKKKIFSLAKMETLVFSDPKLSAVYEGMAENGEEKYGYHYNETIMNMLFNDYVLNSPQYLQKYKMAIPKEKKRRDKSGINQLKKQGKTKMTQSGLAKLEPTENESVMEEEIDKDTTKVVFLVNERDPKDPDLFAYFPEENYDRQGINKTAYSPIGQHSSASPEYAKESRQATPEEYADLKAELEGIGYNLEVLNGMQKTEVDEKSLGAYSSKFDNKSKEPQEVEESTSAGSAGGAAGYVGYAGPAAFSSKGDLSGDFKGKNKKKKVNPKAKPISTGFALSLSESNYLTDPSSWEKYFDKLNEESDATFIANNGSNTYGSVDNMNPENQKIIKKDIQTGKMDSNHNIKGSIALQEEPFGDDNFEQAKAEAQRISREEGVVQHVNQVSDNRFKVSDWYDGDNTVISFENGRQLNETNIQEKAKSKSQQRFMGMVHAVQKGELSPDKVGGSVEKAAKSMSDKDAEDFASTKHKGLPDHVDETMGQPDIDYIVKAFEIVNAGTNYDPAKTERFRANLMQMDDMEAQKVARNLEAMVRKMGYKPENLMNRQLVHEGYSIMNPEPLKQIGWLSLPNYKYGGVAIFEISENDNFGKKVGAEYIIGSPYEFEYRIEPDGENNYIIQQNPRFWQRYASLDTDTNKVLYVDDNEKFKYLGKYNDIKLDPNNRWTYDSETEKFWQEIKKLRREGATFEFNGKPIFDNDNNVKEDMQTMIQNNGTSMSNKAQATGDMSSEVPMGAQQTSGLQEADLKLFEEINKELEAFSIHHDKLKLMAEDKKTPSMVQGDRLRAENPKNFKKDMQNSDTKDVIDVEKKLQWKDQQTDVGDDPQKLGADIEKTEIKTADMKGDEALKNVGNSTNRDGNEIPKRNLTTKEQEEVDLYRNGQHSLNYDNEPSERFVERMKADQGEFFEMGEKQKEFKADAPMYNKDTQPIEDANVNKTQFDKNVKRTGDKVAWNERMGLGSNVKLSESMITGRYIDILGKRRLMEFRLGEVKELKKVDEGAMKLSFDGLGNTYMSKTVDKKVVVNEGVVDIMETYQFYTDGEKVFSVKNPVQSLNEGEVKEKPVVNEQVDKMKHLLGYKPDSYVTTKNVKKNRGF